MEATTPPCRCCGNAEPAIEYPADFPSQAVCPDCCDTAEHADGETGHVWEYDAWERGRVCVKCGIPKACTRYAWDE